MTSDIALEQRAPICSDQQLPTIDQITSSNLSNPSAVIAGSHGHSTAYEPLTPPHDGLHHDHPFSRHVPGAGGDVDVNVDVEGLRGSPPRYTRENDPYQLSSKLKSIEEIDLIKANTSRKRHDRLSFCSPLTSGHHALRAKKLQHFYENQNENIQRLLKPVDDHRREAKESDGDNKLKYKIAVHGSLAANIVLAGLQLYAAVASGSLALFTTMADALFDPLSNVTLMLTNRAVNRVDGRRFPSGKARIETAGNIVFCFIMTAVSLIIIVQSIRDLVEGSKTLTSDFHLASIIAVGIAFATKLCLFLYCFALRNVYSQIRILWEDHRNDLLVNATGIMFSLLGSKVRWWIDPMGAIIISCIIITLWLRTAWSEFHLLIGVTADTHMLQLITYICKFQSYHQHGRRLRK
jgi:divalent metal cation (Fe/Co/Zn/Cd) transporter